MNLNEYQKLALRTASPKSKKNELFHLVLGLCGEAGEVAEKIKKVIRDKESDFDQLDLDDLTKELGDVLWHIAVVGEYFNIPLEVIGAKNIEKLTSRLERGTLAGSGDNR
jgi:NTP pyrophosphatase (non-canonical NTP hydrolase)